MKNALNYYYNLIIDDIHQTGKTFYFDDGHFRYYLVLYEGDVHLLHDIYNLHAELLNRGIYVHQIILNKDGQIVTLINGELYILMKVFYYQETITFDKVLAFAGINLTLLGLDTVKGRSWKERREAVDINQISRVDWGALWSAKNDHLEYQISQLGQKHPLIRESFSYYIGLGETSIQIVNSLSLDNVTKVVAHRRIDKDDTVFELYNPLNLVIDVPVRDMAEYFKNSFFNGMDISQELNYYLLYGQLSHEEYLLFLARMLYPTYYFDLYEDIISGKESDEALKKITDRVDEFEQIIKNIYKYYKSFLNIAPIEWLEN